MVKEDYDEEAFYGQAEKTKPKYLFNDILLQEWNELKNSYVEFKVANENNIKSTKQNFAKKYLSFYFQIKDKNKLAHFNKEQRVYLKYFIDNTDKINKKVSYKLTSLIRNMMNEFGILKMDGYDDDDDGVDI